MCRLSKGISYGGRVKHGWSLRRRITHENKEGFKHVKEVTRVGLVSSIKSLSKNLDHKGKKALERFLRFLSERIQKAVLFGTDNVGFIICVDILGDSTQAPSNKVSIGNERFLIYINFLKKPT